jgi:hypothetical protein
MYNREDDFRTDHRRWEMSQKTGKTFHDRDVHAAMQPAIEHDKAYAEGYRHGHSEGAHETRQNIGAQFSGLKALGRVVRGARAGSHKTKAVKLNPIARSVRARPRRSR